MAKMKIYDIARSLQEKFPNLKSKDLIELLNKNGFEAKSAQSSIEDAAIGFLLKYYQNLSAKNKAAKTESPAEEKKEQASVKKEAAPKKEAVASKKEPEAVKKEAAPKKEQAVAQDTKQQEKTAAASKKEEAPKQESVVEPSKKEEDGKPEAAIKTSKEEKKITAEKETKKEAPVSEKKERSQDRRKRKNQRGRKRLGLGRRQTRAISEARKSGMLLLAGIGVNLARITDRMEIGMAEIETEIVKMGIITIIVEIVTEDAMETGMAGVTADIIITGGTVMAPDATETATTRTVRVVLEEKAAAGRRALTPDVVFLRRWTA